MRNERLVDNLLKEKSRKYFASFDQAALTLGVKDPVVFHDNFSRYLKEFTFNLRGHGLTEKVLDYLEGEADEDEVRKLLSTAGLRSINELNLPNNSDLLLITVNMELNKYKDPFAIDFCLSRLVRISSGTTAIKEIPVITIDWGGDVVKVLEINTDSVNFYNDPNRKSIYKILAKVN